MSGSSGRARPVRGGAARRLQRRREVAVLTVLAAVAATMPGRAAAEWRPSGALDAALLFRDGDVGGGGLVDLWAPVGVFRIGGALGVAAFPSDDAQRSRVFMPFGLSAALVVQGDILGFDLRARAGGWTGATDGGLSAGGWVAVGGHLEYVLDSHVALSAGVDGWFTFAQGDAIYVVPTLGLVWTLAPE